MPMTSLSDLIDTQEPVPPWLLHATVLRSWIGFPEADEGSLILGSSSVSEWYFLLGMHLSHLLLYRQQFGCSARCILQKKTSTAGVFALVHATGDIWTSNHLVVLWGLGILQHRRCQPGCPSSSQWLEDLGVGSLLLVPQWWHSSEIYTISVFWLLLS